VWPAVAGKGGLGFPGPSFYSIRRGHSRG